MSVTPRRPLAVQPHPYIGDVVGRPLDRGMIYFGEPDKDPQDYPITVYLDPEQTKPAHQPIRTKGGFINVFGDITEIFADEILYSLKVLDCYGRLVFYKKRMHRDNITEELGGEIVRAQKAESALQSSIDAEAVRAKAAESDLNANIIKEVSDRESEVTRLDEADAVLQAQINSVGGGKLAYKTYAEMIADKSNIAAKSSIDIIADTDDKNGTYLYDGTDFVKSQYDIETLIRSKVQNTFGTYAQMLASNLSEGSYALVADDIDANNGIYIKDDGAWVKSNYDKLNAPRYMPTATTDINTLTEAGVYMPHSDEASKNFGLPGRHRGVLTVTGEYYPEQVTQVYTSLSGLFLRNRDNNGLWSDWDSVVSKEWFTADLDANDVYSAGIYASAFNGEAAASTNLPYKNDRFLLIVSKSSSARQMYISGSGTAFRYSDLGGNWSDWIKNPSVTGWRGEPRVDKDINYQANTNNVVEAGTYTVSIPDSVFDNSLANLPFDAETKAHVIVDNTGATFRQFYISPAGVASRHGRLSDGAVDESTITQWSGIEFDRYKLTSIADLKQDIVQLKSMSATPSVIYGWGSSTLWLAGDYLADLARAEGYEYVNNALSGETTGVAGMKQGSNIVTVQFSDSTLSNDVYYPVTIAQSFELSEGRSYKEVELSNGVVGLLYFSDNSSNANTFKPTNLINDIDVDTEYKYRVKTPDLIGKKRGLYYFDIGKNNMKYSSTTAEKIASDLQKMIDYIPDESEYLVGGHFLNVGLSATRYKDLIEDTNSILKLRYGKRFCDYYDFLYDDAVWQKHNITKTQDDINAMSKGEMPPSLGRDLGDGTRDTAHLRDEMSEELAIQAINRFKELGYIK